jgi:hypothetical protein
MFVAVGDFFVVGRACGLLIVVNANCRDLGTIKPTAATGGGALYCVVELA